MRSRVHRVHRFYSGFRSGFFHVLSYVLTFSTNLPHQTSSLFLKIENISTFNILSQLNYLPEPHPPTFLSPNKLFILSQKAYQESQHFSHPPPSHLIISPLPTPPRPLTHSVHILPPTIPLTLSIRVPQKLQTSLSTSTRHISTACVSTSLTPSIKTPSIKLR